MSDQNTVRAWLKRSLATSGVLSMGGRFKGPAVAILMFHSVLPDPREQENTLGAIIHSCDVFRAQMELLAREYDPVTLDDVLAFVQGSKSLPPKAVVVTFDDGYADNAEFASPIMNGVGVPGLFYVTVDCIDRKNAPWVARLRNAFRTTTRPSWSGLNGTPWALTSPVDRERAFTAASERCATLTGTVQDQFAAEVEAELSPRAFPGSGRLMMSWDQVRRLVRDGHTVGSHTMTHPNMAHVPGDADLRREFAESKRRLEEEVGSEVIHFSYPCPILQPHWSQRTVGVCRELGYKTAVTTNSGPVRRGDNPMTLRRVPPSKTRDDLRWRLECTFLGRSM